MFSTVQESFTTDVEATAFNALVQSSKVKIIKVGNWTPDIVGDHHSTSRTLLFYLISELVGDQWFMIAENGMAIHVSKGEREDIFYITSQNPNKQFEWTPYDDEDYVEIDIYTAILTLCDVYSGATLTNLTPLHWLDLGTMLLSNAPKLEYGIESQVDFTHDCVRNQEHEHYTATFTVLSRDENTVTIRIKDWVYTCKVINFSEESLEYEKENYFEYKPAGDVAYLNGGYIQFYDTELNKMVRGTDPTHKNIINILNGF